MASVISQIEDFLEESARETVCKKIMIEERWDKFLYVLNAPYGLINGVMHQDLSMLITFPFSFSVLLYIVIGKDESLFCPLFSMFKKKWTFFPPEVKRDGI